MQNQKTKKIVGIGILSAVATVLMLLEFPVPLFVPFLKIDISNLPVILGTFMYGPLSGICIAFIKNALHLFASTTTGVGELADFLITASYVLAAGLIYKKNKTRKTAVIGIIAGIITSTIVGALTNYYILLPFYGFAFGMSIKEIIEICQQFNPTIKNLWGYIFFAVVPFNLIKSTLVGILTLILYKKSSILFKQQNK